MMNQSHTNRILSYCRLMGMSRAELARKADVPYTTIALMFEPEWDPRTSTLRKLEAVIPPDFDPDQERTHAMAKKPCKGGRKK